MIKMAGPKRLFALLMLLICMLSPGRVLAHGGVGIQHLNNEPAGPYRVYVWSDPEPPQVGEYHVIIALTENIAGDATGLAGGPVLDAYVSVEMAHQDSGTTLSARASHDDALNKLFYTATFAPPSKGIWSVQVRIAAPACEDGESRDAENGSSTLPCGLELLDPVVVGFEDEILPKAFPWRAVLSALLSVILMAGAGLLYWKTQPLTTDHCGSQ